MDKAKLIHALKSVMQVLIDGDADQILALRKWEDKGGVSEPEQS